MSYTSGFFDAVDLGGGNYDREYSAAVFAHYFSLLVKNGVFPDPSTGMQVKASSNPDMHVSVQPGNGWVNGYYITVSDGAPELLTVPTANPSLSRIDSVIMGLNYVERKIQLYIKPGAVSASPSAVSLQRDNDLYEMELAQIAVAAGVASISQANITDMRQNTSRCGIVKGTIDQIDTTDLFAQYDNAFQTWFTDIQAQLSGDVAANLQNQINALKGVALGSKALVRLNFRASNGTPVSKVRCSYTASGVSTTVYSASDGIAYLYVDSEIDTAVNIVSPADATIAQSQLTIEAPALQTIQDKYITVELPSISDGHIYTISSSGDFGYFSGRVKTFDVWCCGAGGSGPAAGGNLSYDWGVTMAGGAGGFTAGKNGIVNTQQDISATIGSGGSGVTGTNKSYSSGKAGGASSVSIKRADNSIQTFTAAGGYGGNAMGGTNMNCTGSSGGSGSGGINPYFGIGSAGFDGSAGGASGNIPGGSGQGSTTRAFSEPSGVLYCGAGGGIMAYSSTTTSSGGAGGGSASIGAAAGIEPTMPGAGSGATAFGQSSGTATSKAGANGVALVRVHL